MLYEEDIILHGSTIADSDGLLHGKFKSKHKSKKSYTTNNQKGTVALIANNKKIKLDSFYNKIFGNEKEDTKSLNNELEERLNRLKDIEKEAKKGTIKAKIEYEKANKKNLSIKKHRATFKEGKLKKQGKTKGMKK